METFSFPDRAFDGLAAFNVIHHTTATGIRWVLAEMRRVLNPGGWFYATVVAREESNIVRYWIGCIIRATGLKPNIY